MSDETTPGAEGAKTLPGTKPGWKMETAEGRTPCSPLPEDGPPTIVAVPAATDDPTPRRPPPDEDDADGDDADEGGEPPRRPAADDDLAAAVGSLALLLLLALLLGGATTWLWRDKTPEPTPTDQDAHLVVGGYVMYNGVSRDSRGTLFRTTPPGAPSGAPRWTGRRTAPCGVSGDLCGDRPR